MYAKGLASVNSALKEIRSARAIALTCRLAHDLFASHVHRHQTKLRRFRADELTAQCARAFFVTLPELMRTFAFRSNVCITGVSACDPARPMCISLRSTDGLITVTRASGKRKVIRCSLNHHNDDLLFSTLRRMTNLRLEVGKRSSSNVDDVTLSNNNDCSEDNERRLIELDAIDAFSYWSSGASSHDWNCRQQHTPFMHRLRQVCSILDNEQQRISTDHAPETDETCSSTESSRDSWESDNQDDECDMWVDSDNSEE